MSDLRLLSKDRLAMCGHLFPAVLRQRVSRVPRRITAKTKSRTRTAWRQAQQSFLLPFVRLKIQISQPMGRRTATDSHRLIRIPKTRPGSHMSQTGTICRLVRMAQKAQRRHRTAQMALWLPGHWNEAIRRMARLKAVLRCRGEHDRACPVYSPL